MSMRIGGRCKYFEVFEMMGDMLVLAVQHYIWDSDLLVIVLFHAGDVLFYVEGGRCFVLFVL